MARIVVIEDDGALRNDIADTLREWGHSVFQAKDGATGVDAIFNTVPDLVLCDICLPGTNGFDLARQVKDSDTCSAAVIIFMSSLSEHKDLVYARFCGGDDYVVKPIDYGVLKTKVDHHLTKHESLVLKMTKWIAFQPDNSTAEFVERRLQPNSVRPFGRRKTDT